jgi:hypothetical protein
MNAHATLIVLLATTFPALAIECHSVGGHLDRRPVSAVRIATLKGSQLTLNGTFNAERSPTRKLPCVRLHSGVLCERQFGPVFVTIMSNESRLLETVTDPAGNEIASIAYQCSGRLRL